MLVSGRGSHVSKSWDDLQSKGLHRYESLRSFGFGIFFGGPLTIFVPSHVQVFCVAHVYRLGLVLYLFGYFGLVFFLGGK